MPRFPYTRAAGGFALALSAFVSTPCWAVPLFLDLSAGGAYGKSGFASEASAPSMGHYTGDLTLGLTIRKKFKLGARTAYSQIIQFSESSENGNRRGHRFAVISPVLGIELGRFELRGDYQFLGDYTLASTDDSGNQVIYSKPSGFGAKLLYSLGRRISIGARYEMISFSAESLAGSESDLAEKLTLSSFGALFHVKF
jgi:hypothetical protein